jgi:hypothetical protein
MFNVPKVREEWIRFWFYWCFSTNRAHAHNLYLVFASKTHFEQNIGELVDFPNSTSENSEPATCTLSKMLPASTINASLQTAGRAKNMGDTILRIIISIRRDYEGLHLWD